MPFGVIFKTFSQMLQNSKNATLSSEMLGLGGVGPPFRHLFCLLFERVFCVGVYTAFLVDLGGVGPPKRVPYVLHFRRFRKFCMQK